MPVAAPVGPGVLAEAESHSKIDGGSETGKGPPPRVRNSELGFQVPLDPDDQPTQESASGRAFLAGPVGTASRGGLRAAGSPPPHGPQELQEHQA